MILIILTFLPLKPIDFLEYKLLDFRFMFSKQHRLINNVVLVTIDNRSEDRIGRWPWDRTKIAQLINNISQGKPAVIGLDIVFAEKQISPLEKILSLPDAKSQLQKVNLEKIRKACDYDSQLAEAIAKASNVVLGYYFFTDGPDTIPDEIVQSDPRYKNIRLKSEVFPVLARVQNQKSLTVKKGHGLESSIELISSASKAQGYLNIFPDSDGVVRKSFLVMKQGQDWLSSFPLQILKIYRGASATPLTVTEVGIIQLKIGDWEIPVGLDGSLLVDYTKDLNSFPSYSVIDVLDGSVPPSVFSGKIVLVGITDPGLMRDNWITPTEIVSPGVKIHALTIATCLEGTYIYQVGYVDLLNLFFIIIFGFLLTVAIPRIKLIQAAFLAIFLFIAYVMAAFLFFRKAHVALNMVYPLLCIVSVYTTETLRHTGISLTRALRKVLQKESALRMLGETQQELSQLVRVSDIFHPSSSSSMSPFLSETILADTPVLTWKVILTSLGINSGALVLFNTDGSHQMIVSIGPLLNKINLEVIRKQLELSESPFLVNHPGKKNEWVFSPDIRNLMAFSVVSGEGFRLVGIFLNKSATAFSDSEQFTLEDVKLAQTAALQAIIAIQNSKLNIALKQAQLETIFRLAMSIECRDRETGLHVHRVSEYAGIVAEGINLSDPEVKLIKSAMPLHDIGKIAVPDSILLKPGRLTDEELAIMRKHPIVGAKILEGSSSAILSAARVIALSHQERYDGSGYPYGLKGEQIPLYGRIAAVSDVFDALASKRTYKEALSLEKTIEIINQESGKSLDPSLVRVFLERMERVLKVYHQYKESPDTSPFEYPLKQISQGK
ncbi:MAG TPA: CHASE2 domain-containing protein [bacterium]|nr:CHASE2 domain-containing protein [bacterium]HOL34375.1 CHASE2 domain-containing protein [bacterium]HPP07940.1 CHASE2 domain-containing protein [bacterium]